jgi:chemotaxis protein CheC
MDKPLSESQVQRLAATLHAGACRASQAMAKWLSVPSVVEFDSLEQLPLSDAVDVLGGADQTLCFCFMEITGSLTGEIVLAFDDSSGLSLSDLLLDHPVGHATEWGEVETSAALETANIVGCAYLSALSQDVTEPNGEPLNLLPSPPTFRREFAESLLQTVFLEQALASDFIVAARTTFQIRGQRLNWKLLFVPDATSMARLRELITGAD